MGRDGELARVTMASVAAGMVALNASMVAVLVPTLAGEFAVRPAAGAWLVAVYLVVTTVLQPLTGRLGDLAGRRRVLLAGLVGFGLASALVAVAPAWLVLLAGRVLQAAAGAVIVPNALALLCERVSPARLGSALGVASAALPLAAMTGGPLATGLAGLGGWRLVLLVNLPLVLVALALVGRSPAPAPTRAADAKGAQLDLGGMALFGAVVAGATALAAAPMPSPARTALAAGLAAALAVLVRRSRRHPNPALPLGLLRRPGFGASAAALTFGNVALGPVLVGVPLLLSARAGVPGLAIGAAVSVLAGAGVVGTAAGGRLSDRGGRRLPAVAGLGAAAAGLVLVALAPGSLPVWGVLIALALAGLGFGLCSPALEAAGLEAAGQPDAGVAAGLLGTAGYFGSLLGTALLIGPLAPGGAGPGGFSALFGALAGIAAAAAVVALALPSRRQGRAGSDLTTAPGEVVA